VNELYTAWSLHEPDRIDAIFTDDAAYEDVAGGHVLHGKLEVKQLLSAAFAWAPDFRVTMTSLTIAGDTGTTEWVIEKGLRPVPFGPGRSASSQPQGGPSGCAARRFSYFGRAESLRSQTTTTWRRSCANWVRRSRLPIRSLAATPPYSAAQRMQVVKLTLQKSNKNE
jgi:SnoaL-like domain